MIGLKRGMVSVVPYDSNWSKEAKKIIDLLKEILKDKATSIEHVGSTSIIGLEAKPIIDIAVATKKIEEILNFKEALEAVGIIDCGSHIEGQHLFVMGDFKEDTRTAHIHVVLEDSKAFKNYLKFRDTLNEDSKLKEAYANLKKELALQYPNDRNKYTEGKADFIHQIVEG